MPLTLVKKVQQDKQLRMYGDAINALGHLLEVERLSRLVATKKATAREQKLFNINLKHAWKEATRAYGTVLKAVQNLPVSDHIKQR